MSQRRALLVAISLPGAAFAGDLVQQVAAVCVQQNATPSHITQAEAPAYCACEAGIWANRGSETDLRAAMTYTTGDRRHMNGVPYSADAALNFIATHYAEVEQKCAG